VPQTYCRNDPVSGRWSGVNRLLTEYELDDNFYSMIQRVMTLETGANTTVSIDYITQDPTNGTLVFHMTDHTTRGPFTVPDATFHDRVAWAALTPYLVNDTFSINGTLYLVIFAHTSQATFSAGANDGLGHSYYSPMLTIPGNSLPTGGAAGMMLYKVDGHDFLVSWKYPVPVGGSTGQYLTKVNGTDFNMQWSSSPSVSVENLSDVSYTSPHSVGQVLQWTGSEWQNTTLSVTFAEISDIALTSPHSVGDVLTWNGSNWQNEPGLAPTAIGTTVQAYDAQLFSNIPQNSNSADYTTVLTDGEKHILHPAADTTARTFTIDSNANVAYPVGTAITFVNQHGGGVITIAITSDTMRLAGAGTTGNRTLAEDGIATALKIVTTEWIISGTGLT
jgi:hypothetical protein